MTIAVVVNTVTCVILHPEMEINCWGIHVALESLYCFSLTVERAFKHHLRKKFLCRCCLHEFQCRSFSGLCTRSHRRDFILATNTF